MNSSIKKIGLTALLALAAFSFSTNDAQAATFTYHPVADMDVFSGDMGSMASNNPDLSFYLPINEKPLLKFDLADAASSVNGNLISTADTITSAFLRLHVEGAMLGVPTMLNLFMSNNWSEPLYDSAAVPLTTVFTDDFNTIPRFPISFLPLPINVASIHPQWLDIALPTDQAGVMNLVRNYLASTNGVFSMELSSLPGMPVSGDQFAVFGSRESDFSPELVINTLDAAAPTPEPSSIIMGIMSISGLLGLKRKNRSI